MTAFRLFSETTIKQWYTSEGTTDFNSKAPERDQLITMLNGIISRAEQYCNQKFDYEEDYVQIVRPSGFTLFLNRKPVYSIASIVPLIDGVYDIDNAIDDTSYYLDENCIRAKSGEWCHRKYQVTYTAGYIEYLQEDSSGGTSLPYDLAEGIMTQLRWEFQNRKTVGVTSSTDIQGNRTQLNPWGLLPGVQLILNKYKIL